MSESERKRVLLTGGSRGIGAAVKSLLEASGYRVFAPSREELDLSACESVESFINSTPSEFDVLINNAGINPIKQFGEFTREGISEVLDIDLVSPVLLMQFCAAGMKTRLYGRIVNVSSIWASVSKSGRGAYSAAKAGLEGVTRTAAIELGQYGILVNAVAPGFVVTELTRKNNTDSELHRIAESLPLRRLAEPYEIARFIEFLSSEANTFITGQSLRIDGGYSCL